MRHHDKQLAVAALLMGFPAFAQEPSKAVPANEPSKVEAVNEAEASPVSVNNALPTDAQGAPPPGGSQPAEVAAVGGDQKSPKKEVEEEVRISGARPKETGGSIYIVRKKQLERFAYDDPHQVLLGVPGVNVRGEDGMGLRPNIGMRGVASDRSKKITLMEDGILFGPAPYSAPAAYYFPIIERMNQVRVIKGPASVVYGPHTVAGAIDLVTADIPSERKGMLTLGAGMYGYNKLHLSYGVGDDQYGFLVEGVHLGNTGFKVLDSGGDTGFSRNEWMTKGRIAVDISKNERHIFELKLGYSNEDSNETYLGLTDTDLRANPYRRYDASSSDHMKWHRTQVEVKHKLEAGRDFTLTTTLYRHDLDRTWRKANRFESATMAEVLANPTGARNAVLYSFLTGKTDSASPIETLYIGPNHRMFVSQGIQTVAKYKVKTGPVDHKMEMGLRGHFDSIERVHTEDGFTRINGALVQKNAATLVTANNEVATHALAWWLVDTVHWKNLTVTPGIRVESIVSQYHDALTGENTGTKQGAVIPGVGAHYAITEEFGVLAGVHRGFSPNPADSGTDRPESSVSVETGVRYSTRRVHAELIGFYNGYSNLTNVCTFSNGCLGPNLDRVFSGGSARVFGAEAFVEADPKLVEDYTLPFRLAYTYSDTAFQTAFQSADPSYGSVVPGDELPYVPRHQLAGSVGIEHPRFGVHFAGTFVDRMRETAGQGVFVPGTTTDAYFTADLSGKFKASKAVSFLFNARNLFGAEYIVSRRPFGARPGAPRWVTVGLRLDF